MEEYDCRKVDITNICTDKRLIEGDIWIRTYLKLPLKNINTGLNISVILMNPSHADQSFSDKSVNKVIDFFVDRNQNVECKVKVENVYILNIFPVCSPKPKDAYNKLWRLQSSNSLDVQIQNNENQIKDIVQNSEYIVLAWGLPSSGSIPYILFYEKALAIVGIIESQKRPMNVFKVSNITKILSETGDPRHPAGIKNEKLIGLFRLERGNLLGLR